MSLPHDAFWPADGICGLGGISMDSVKVLVGLKSFAGRDYTQTQKKPGPFPTRALILLLV